MDSPIFIRDLAYVFVAAIAGGMLAWRLRQPVILGYVLAGIAISPITLGPSVSDVHTLELFAEIGVILLMFSVGLEFSVRDLMRAKWVAMLGGPIGILLSIGLGLVTGSVLGWTPGQAVVVGATISVASTMVLTRLLLDQGQMHTDAGRVMVAITLVEDLAVVVLIVLVPSFGNLEMTRVWALLQELGRAAAILVPAFFAASKVIPPLLQRVARTQRRELFFIVVLAICLGTAALTQAVGLSLAFGAFVAGLIISGSEYAHEALAELFALREAFVALFFVTMGLLMDPRMLFSNLPIVAAMIFLIVFGKLGIWTGVVSVFGYPLWTALTVGIGLTQIGEFSFVLVQVARASGVVGSEIYNATLAASLVTILLNAALVKYVPAALARRQLERRMATAPAASPESALSHHVVLGGFGRVGSAIGAALETFEVPYIVVEIDPDICATLRSRGVPSLFGNLAQPHILHKVGVEGAALVIVTVPDPHQARSVITNTRRLNRAVPILARAHRKSDHETLIRAGATEIIQPEMEASATLIRHAFTHLGISDEQIRAYLRGFRETMESFEGEGSLSRLAFPEVREIALASSALIGRTLGEAQIRRRFGVTVIAILRASGKTIVNPPPDTVFEQGDTLRVIGLPEEIDAFSAPDQPRSG